MFRTVFQRRRLRAVATALVVAAGVTPVGAPVAWAATAVTVDTATTYQRVDGFGFSQAFGQAKVLGGALGLSAANQREVLDLLFDRSRGAGFSILRNLIDSGAANTIAPTAPSGPSATPTWRWDGTDRGQVWLSKQALAYGVRTIYADAWSAPGYMKTNGSEVDGGTLCGMPGASCASGDWRRAYADYLVKYVQLNRDSGVPITHLGFVNEPELTTTYSSMIVNGAQAADFVKVLDSRLRANGLDLEIVCCDAMGWRHGNDMVNTIARDGAAFSALDVAGRHGYSSPPTTPFTQAAKPTWMTEWANFDPFTTAWDDGSAGSGFTWADRTMTALTSANVSAFLHWWGAANSTANSPLIRLNGDSFQTSSRLWALANYSRYIRPGATRVSATAADADVKVAAFRNADGSLAVVALNTTRSAVSVPVTLRGTDIGTQAVPHLTNGSNNTAAQTPVTINGGAFTSTIPARSLVTYEVRS
ncbi:glycoside hydrolase family 30 protein [Saccharothrix luteola]|uniref:glycoside hydrolase family 30 protein n=1 Tax=Saccharothrix luteola TaxID=2893018 RepID=UPI001E432340|nr:glycoside hydrolase family 30 beta sandwich domain-containing protein [Saccharothrix luteola]MCC8246260.1 hypothetical protein [Saccharothrix luteola]